MGLVAKHATCSCKVHHISEDIEYTIPQPDVDCLRFLLMQPRKSQVEGLYLSPCEYPIGLAIEYEVKVYLVDRCANYR